MSRSVAQDFILRHKQLHIQAGLSDHQNADSQIYAADQVIHIATPEWLAARARRSLVSQRPDRVDPGCPSGR